MTTDIFNACGDNASNDFSVEARSASTLQLAEDENLSSRALAIITPALADWAVRKNLPLPVEGIELAARYTLEKIPTEMVGLLLAFDPAALQAMRRAVNTTLDVWAVMQLGCCLADLEGKEPPDPMTMLGIAERNVAAGQALAADPLDPIVWGDLMELAAKQRQALRSHPAHEAEHA
jgi:hypothetical protein